MNDAAREAVMDGIMAGRGTSMGAAADLILAKLAELGFFDASRLTSDAALSAGYDALQAAYTKWYRVHPPASQPPMKQVYCEAVQAIVAVAKGEMNRGTS